MASRSSLLFNLTSSINTSTILAILSSKRDLIYVKQLTGSLIINLLILNFMIIWFFYDHYSECLPLNSGMSGNFGLSHLDYSSDTNASIGVGAVIGAGVITDVSVGTV